MAKITLLLALLCLYSLAVHAAICNRRATVCTRNERRAGRTDDVTRTFNEQCRRSDRQWRDITRCQLSSAICRLTARRCATLTCANVRRALRS